MKDYQFFDDLRSQIPEIPTDSIISRTFYQDEDLKVIIFGFAKDQELSEHTASVPAIIHILKGEARVTLGNETKETQNGSWMIMPPNLSHSIFAKTQLTMLLYMLRT